jgi:hypothetical protein
MAMLGATLKRASNDPRFPLRMDGTPMKQTMYAIEEWTGRCWYRLVCTFDETEMNNRLHDLQQRFKAAQFRVVAL